MLFFNSSFRHLSPIVKSRYTFEWHRRPTKIQAPDFTKLSSTETTGILHATSSYPKTIALLTIDTTVARGYFNENVEAPESPLNLIWYSRFEIFSPFC